MLALIALSRFERMPMLSFLALSLLSLSFAEAVLTLTLAVAALFIAILLGALRDQHGGEVLCKHVDRGRRAGILWDVWDSGGVRNAQIGKACKRVGLKIESERAQRQGLIIKQGRLNDEMQVAPRSCCVGEHMLRMR